MIMRIRRRGADRMGRILLLLPVAALLRSGPALAEPALAPGDIVEVAVMGFPDSRQRLTVQSDGTISSPLVGSLPVAGLSGDAIRAKVQTAIIGKTLRHRLPDGQFTALLVEPDDVFVSAIDYRPVYVSGDVGKPGEHVFRPQLTVARAVALAGGIDGRRLLGQGTAVPWDIDAEYTSLWGELAKEKFRFLRAKVIVGITGDGEPDPLLGTPLGKEVIAEIQKTSSKIEEVEAADYQKERASIERSLETLEKQIAVLTRQLKDEEQGVQADVDEFDYVRNLLTRGAATAQRVSDARRSVLLSSTRALQTNSQLLLAKKQREEFVRQHERVEDQRRLVALREMEAARLRIGQVRNRLASLQRLMMTGASPTRAVGLMMKPTFSVLRRSESSTQRYVADEDTVLAPGDVLYVTIGQNGSVATKAE